MRYSAVNRMGELIKVSRDIAVQNSFERVSFTFFATGAKKKSEVKKNQIFRNFCGAKRDCSLIAFPETNSPNQGITERFRSTFRYN